MSQTQCEFRSIQDDFNRLCRFCKKKAGNLKSTVNSTIKNCSDTKMILHDSKSHVPLAKQRKTIFEEHSYAYLDPQTEVAIFQVS